MRIEDSTHPTKLYLKVFAARANFLGHAAEQGDQPGVNYSSVNEVFRP
jgi:hypothetical protein